MKDFVVRLGLVIHWFGFILGFIAFGGLMVGGFMEEGSDDVAMFLSAPVFCFLFWGMGWLIRYILSGKCDPYSYKE